MATTVTGGGPVLAARVALDATASNVEQVTLPSWCRRVTVQFKQTDDATDEKGWIVSGAADGAAKSTEWFEVPSGSALEVLLVPGRGRLDGGAVLYLAAASNSAQAHLLLQVA